MIVHSCSALYEGIRTLEAPMRRACLFACVVTLAVLLAAPVLAGERLRFKNGHNIVVDSVEIKGEREPFFVSSSFGTSLASTCCEFSTANS